jgi:hypothetical protein
VYIHIILYVKNVSTCHSGIQNSRSDISLWGTSGNLKSEIVMKLHLSTL